MNFKDLEDPETLKQLFDMLEAMAPGEKTKEMLQVIGGALKNGQSIKEIGMAIGGGLVGSFLQAAVAEFVKARSALEGIKDELHAMNLESELTRGSLDGLRDAINMAVTDLNHTTR